MHRKSRPELSRFRDWDPESAEKSADRRKCPGLVHSCLLYTSLEKYDSYVLSISATTRAPREGEQDGREYFFRTKEEFEQMIADGALLEHACYVGNYYGTPRAWVEAVSYTHLDVYKRQPGILLFQRILWFPDRNCTLLGVQIPGRPARRRRIRT